MKPLCQTVAVSLVVLFSATTTFIVGSASAQTQPNVSTGKDAGKTGKPEIGSKGNASKGAETEETARIKVPTTSAGDIAEPAFDKVMKPLKPKPK